MVVYYLVKLSHLFDTHIDGVVRKYAIRRFLMSATLDRFSHARTRSSHHHTLYLRGGEQRQLGYDLAHGGAARQPC